MQPRSDKSMLMQRARTTSNRSGLTLLTLLLVAGFLLATGSPRAEGAGRSGSKPAPAAKTAPSKPSQQPPARLAFVEFDHAPFPYDGVMPGTNTPFLNVSQGTRRGHRARSGRIFWQDETYRDRRVLLYIPRGFDPSRPAAIVVFFHGHGTILRRDVLNRQRVPAQIAASGSNAVLVAPQFAVNAPDSSAGKFWEPGGFARFLREAAQRLAVLHGDPQAAQAFAKMPIVLVAYSGGYLAAAWSLKVGGVGDRVRGVILLDALYGELDHFAEWIAGNKDRFFISAYTNSTQPKNAVLKKLLGERQIGYETNLRPRHWQQGVTFLAAGAKADHWTFVTRGWVDYPIKHLLSRLDEYRR
ncbi:MAG TPA: alpha/beta hydrolase [Xanthobacteraceae bacterium]|nr:alpha/beta hydrolase [Xanthobacteraceae bacterium]